MSNSKFLMRIAGLPIEVIDNLTFYKSIKINEEYKKLLMDIDNKITEITDSLYTMVNETTDEETKKKYVTLKRDIFNKRYNKLKSYELDEFPDSIKEETNRLISMNNSAVQLKNNLNLEFNKEILEKRNIIKDYVSKEEFLRAVQVSNRALYNRIFDYLECDKEVLPKKLRNSEISLVNYLTRMAYKPTPFSTFTGLSYGGFSNKKSEFNLDTSNKFCFCQINITYFRYIEANLLKLIEVKRKSFFSINSTITQKDDGIIYINRSAVDKNYLFEKEKVTKIKENDLIDAIKEIFSHKEIVSYQEIIEEINNKCNCKDEDAKEYLSLLQRIGILNNFFVYPNQHSNYLEKMCEKLPEIDSPIVKKCYEKLSKLLNIQNKFGVSSHDVRSNYEKEIKNLLAEVYDILGINYEIRDESLVFEDTQYTKSKANINIEEAKKYEEELKLLEVFMKLFDDSIILKLSLKIIFLSYLKETDEVDLIDFYIMYSKYDKKKIWKEIQQDDSYKKVRELRYEFYNYLDEKLKEEQDVLCLDIDWVKSFINKYPKVLFEDVFYSFYIQLLNDSGKHSIVLNKFGPGIFKHYSRYCNMFLANDLNDSFTEDIRKQFIRIGEEHKDIVFADLNGVLGFNVNVHPVMIENEITYLGCCPNKESNQIHIKDLKVRYDKSSEKVKIMFKNKKLELVPLGFLFSMLAPDFYKFLTSFCESNGTEYSFWNKYHIESGKEGFHQYPRLKLADIVLDRKTWVIPKEFLNLSKIDINTFFENLEVLDNNNIDREVFIKVSSLLDTFKEEYVNSDFDAWIQEITNKKLRKPQYINFNSLFYQEVVKKLLDKATNTVFFQEVLPNRENKIENTSNVFELLIDIN